jgi:flagella basal body P-ring formation protein FlgA
MAKTLSASRAAQASPPLRLAPAQPPERRARVGQLAVAVVLVALGVLGAYWFAARNDAKVAVAVLARDVKRGDTVTADDVASVGISVDNPIDAIRFEYADTAVAGRTATGDLAKGTVITQAMLSSGAAVPAGKAVVGFSLAPGEYPVGAMAPGMAVQVVRAPKTGPGEVLVERADVYAVEGAPTGSGSQQVFVSVVVDEAAVPSVSAAASASEVRLAVVP